MYFKALTLTILTLFSTSFYAQDYGISTVDVEKAQEAWGDGIVKIGEIYLEDGNYKEAAMKHIMNSYDYADGSVLFKPTMAAERPFRPTAEGALSYFVGGNDKFPEDKGFAIKPWTNVRFENHNIITYGMKGIAMGHYYFTDLKGKETKVEFTLGFLKRGDDIKITIQDSSLPFDDDSN